MCIRDSCEGLTERSSSINLIVQPAIKKEQSYINIYGNKGQIVISNTNNRSFKLYRDSGAKVDIYHNDIQGFTFSEYLQLHHFAQTILGKTRKVSNTELAVDVMKLAVALEKAAVLSTRVTL